MRKIIAVLALVAGLLGFNAIDASAARAVDGPTFTLVTSDALDPYAAHAVDLWSTRTGINVVSADSCSGPYCIVAVVEPVNCGTAGCANPQPDGSCRAQVDPGLLSGWPDETISNTLAHEAGHCIIWALGGNVSWHASTSRDLMYFGINSGDPLKPLTHETRAYLKSLLYPRN